MVVLPNVICQRVCEIEQHLVILLLSSVAPLYYVLIGCRHFANISLKSVYEQFGRSATSYPKKCPQNGLIDVLIILTDLYS